MTEGIFLDLIRFKREVGSAGINCTGGPHQCFGRKIGCRCKRATRDLEKFAMSPTNAARWQPADVSNPTYTGRQLYQDKCRGHVRRSGLTARSRTSAGLASIADSRA